MFKKARKYFSFTKTIFLQPASNPYIHEKLQIDLLKKH
jgi:hypothetical protein